MRKHWKKLWHLRHPQRAKLLMKDIGIKTPYDELKCPRCGQVIKPKGIPVEGSFFEIFSRHLGSIKCDIQSKLKKQLTYGQITNICRREIKKEMNKRLDRPLCACGCGNKVNYDATDRKWFRFINGHNSLQSIEMLNKKLSLVQDGEFQSDLSRKLNSTRNASRLVNLLVKKGLLKRSRILHNGKWTYSLFKNR